MAGGERTFKASFSAEGVAALRDRIREKLNELMDDYADDTLVVSCPPPVSRPLLPPGARSTDPSPKTLAVMPVRFSTVVVADKVRRMLGFRWIVYDGRIGLV